MCIPKEAVPPDGGGVAETEGGNDGGDAAVRKGQRETEDDGRRRRGQHGGWETDTVEDGAGAGGKGVACMGGTNPGADGHVGKVGGGAG